ncbi:MAG: hypothetical protein ABH950_05990 [Candidatus Altiarchaeota archaeon]
MSKAPGSRDTGGGHRNHRPIHPDQSNLPVPLPPRFSSDDGVGKIRDRESKWTLKDLTGLSNRMWQGYLDEANLKFLPEWQDHSHRFWNLFDLRRTLSAVGEVFEKTDASIDPTLAGKLQESILGNQKRFEEHPLIHGQYAALLKKFGVIDALPAWAMGAVTSEIEKEGKKKDPDPSYVLSLFSVVDDFTPLKQASGETGGQVRRFGNILRESINREIQVFMGKEGEDDTGGLYDQKKRFHDTVGMVANYNRFRNVFGVDVEFPFEFYVKLAEGLFQPEDLTPSVTFAKRGLRGGDNKLLEEIMAASSQIQLVRDVVGGDVNFANIARLDVDHEKAVGRFLDETKDTYEGPLASTLPRLRLLLDSPHLDKDERAQAQGLLEVLQTYAKSGRLKKVRDMQERRRRAGDTRARKGTRLLPGGSEEQRRIGRDITDLIPAGGVETSIVPFDPESLAGKGLSIGKRDLQQELRAKEELESLLKPMDRFLDFFELKTALIDDVSGLLREGQGFGLKAAERDQLGSMLDSVKGVRHSQDEIEDRIEELGKFERPLMKTVDPYLSKGVTLAKEIWVLTDPESKAGIQFKAGEGQRFQKLISTAHRDRRLKDIIWEISMGRKEEVYKNIHSRKIINPENLSFDPRYRFAISLGALKNYSLNEDVRRLERENQPVLTSRGKSLGNTVIDSITQESVGHIDLSDDLRFDDDDLTFTYGFQRDLPFWRQRELRFNEVYAQSQYRQYYGLEVEGPIDVAGLFDRLDEGWRPSTLEEIAKVRLTDLNVENVKSNIRSFRDDPESVWSDRDQNWDWFREDMYQGDEERTFFRCLEGLEGLKTNIDDPDPGEIEVGKGDMQEASRRIGKYLEGTEEREVMRIESYGGFVDEVKKLREFMGSLTEVWPKLPDGTMELLESRGGGSIYDEGMSGIGGIRSFIEELAKVIPIKK